MPRHPILARAAIGFLLVSGLTPAMAAEHKISKAPLLFQADELVNDQDLGIVTAKGHVEIDQEDQVLLADTVVYNVKEDLVTASGNVSLLEKTGQVSFADWMEITGDFKDGTAHQLRMLMVDKSRLAAAIGERHEGTINDMYRAVYSRCEPCKDDPSAAPIWQLKAAQAIHNNETHLIEYEDATLDMFGWPVAYTPYLSHPDPTVKRESGFLIPSFGKGASVGTNATIPYYLVIDDQSDVLIEPNISSARGDMLYLDHRERFTFGETRTRGSITKDQTGAWRGHIDAGGIFDLTQDWRAGYDVVRESDQTYLRVYGYNALASPPWLTSRAYAEGFFGRSYAVIEGYSYQGQGAGDNPDQSPTVAPYLGYSYVGDPGFAGGYFTVDTSAVALTRISGFNTRRSSVTGAWQLPYTFPDGQFVRLKTSLRADYYQAHDYGFNNTTISTLDAGRVIPDASVEWRYPFVRNSDNWQQTIEPIAMLAVSPYNTNNKFQIPNEDSLDRQLDESNLFRDDRFTGYDRMDEGPRAAYGLQYGIYGNHGGRTTILLGQAYRLRGEDAPTPGYNTFNQMLSNPIGKIVIAPSQMVDLSYRFQLDASNLRKHVLDEASFGIGPPIFRVGGSFLNVKAPPGQTEFPDRRQVGVNINSAFAPHWSVGLADVQDMEKGGGPLMSSVSLKYDDECFTANLLWTDNHTSDRDFTAGQSIVLQLMFKTLGEIPIKLQ